MRALEHAGKQRYCMQLPARTLQGRASAAEQSKAKQDDEEKKGTVLVKLSTGCYMSPRSCNAPRPLLDVCRKPRLVADSSTRQSMQKKPWKTNE
mmetsp:Transcript_56429/g.123306  ORF Transcript_56429/g.123306 Transcript_56429/m.123306 type:complete len:94 (-) Transcript_56429:1028-1309(-)